MGPERQEVLKKRLCFAALCKKVEEEEYGGWSFRDCSHGIWCIRMFKDDQIGTPTLCIGLRPNTTTATVLVLPQREILSWEGVCHAIKAAT